MPTWANPAAIAVMSSPSRSNRFRNRSLDDADDKHTFVNK